VQTLENDDLTVVGRAGFAQSVSRCHETRRCIHFLTGKLVGQRPASAPPQARGEDMQAMSAQICDGRGAIDKSINPAPDSS
jgi:hypothetical protein